MVRIVERPSDPVSVNDLAERLYAFNAAATGYHNGADLDFMIEEAGEMIAGLSGYTWGGIAKVKILWVEDDHRHRGLGSALLKHAIAVAAARGCRHMFLTTHSFQAPHFYKRHGFEEIAVVPDKPVGHAEHVMRLTLTP